MAEKKQKRYKITYHKNECIGAFACVAAEPRDWIEDDVGDRADLIEGKDIGDEVYVKEMDDLGNNLEAAQSCPVNCIHIEDRKENKKLI